MPEHKSLNIIFEDDTLLVLDKPSGLVVNRSNTTPTGTLQDMLDEYLSLGTSENVEFVSRSGLVHRLDKDTSGVILVAKTPEKFVDLQNQFKSREVQKVYRAVVFGHFHDKNIEVRVPIIRDPKNRLKMAVSKEGKEAFTRFEVVENFMINDTKLTRLIAMPKTGRMHQIRVHLVALGHPIVGDKIYSSKKQLGFSDQNYKRLMLHAHKISIFHDKKVTFESKLPVGF